MIQTPLYLAMLPPFATMLPPCYRHKPPLFHHHFQNLWCIVLYWNCYFVLKYETWYDIWMILLWFMNIHVYEFDVIFTWIIVYLLICHCNRYRSKGSIVLMNFALSVYNNSVLILWELISKSMNNPSEMMFKTLPYVDRPGWEEFIYMHIWYKLFLMRSWWCSL